MTLKFALAAGSLFCAAGLVPAEAQTANVYINGGYSQVDANKSPGAVIGRVGVSLGQYFAVEGDAEVGVVKDGGVKLTNGFGAYGLAKYPVGQHFDVFGRIGIAETDFKSNPVTSRVPSGSNSGAAWGVGGDYFLTDHDGLRLDWTRHQYSGGFDEYALAYVRKF